MKTETIYIAEDGTRFDREDECIGYEKSYKKDFYKMIGDMNYIYTNAENIYPMGDCSNSVLFVDIKNEEQAKRFAEWCEQYDVYINADEAVGNVLICDCYDNDGGVDTIYQVYECVKPHELIKNFLIKNFSDHIYNYVRKLMLQK